MTPQEISLIVVLVVIAGYVIAALFSRSKTGEEPADIMLETRIPKSGGSRDLLIPAVDASIKNTRKPRRKSARTPRTTAKEEPADKTQQHHESPKLTANSDRKSAPAKTAPPETATTRPVQPVAAPALKPEPEPAPVEVIDPKLTGQISELDDRLDAIEKLVSSIEESLAAFDDSPAGESQAA